MFAVDRGHLEIVKLLLSKGADVNARTEDGRTALSLVGKTKCSEIRTLLLKHGTKDEPQVGDP